MKEIVHKSIAVESVDAMMARVRGLMADNNVRHLTFTGNVNKSNSVESYNVSWDVEEEVPTAAEEAKQ